MSWFWGRASKKSSRRYEARSLLKQHQAKFFARLCKALPTFYIFPQVALSALLTPTASAGRRQQQDSEKLADLKVDYAIYNANLTLVCIVHLNDGSGDPAADAFIDHCLKAAGVKTMRWEVEARPSVEQIRRAMLPSINQAMAAPDTASQAALQSEVTILAHTKLGGAHDTPDTVMQMRQSDPEPGNLKGLSLSMLEKLTPDKVLQSNYPHIWQRICTFASEPKHLKKYLLSLSMQDRDEKRAGFPLEALKEIADIQIHNDRFLTDAVRGWQPGFVNP